jgi:energy-coupling factor transport system substrate-specific component
MMMHRWTSGAIYLLCGLLGLLALIYPFLGPVRSAETGFSTRPDAPLMTALVMGLALIALLLEILGRTMHAKTVSMLGVLVAGTSLLRFIEVAVPLPGGFSPIFAPIILVGFVFGARFGFLMGTFTILTSALITGGIGPWLPYQMFTAGWVGLTAGWLGRLLPQRGAGQSAQARYGWLEIVALTTLGFAWGLVYGVVINVYFWPLATGTAEQAYQAGLSIREVLARYGAFYLATSLVWDMSRAVGNVAMILLLGAPMVKALSRFRLRFRFVVQADA